MTPARLFRLVARAEAVTWALLLAGMFLKHVTRTTELGVPVFGMLHGVVFIAYCVAAVVVGVDQRWSPGRLLAGLVAAVPPFATLAFERYAVRAGLLDDRWRLRHGAPGRALERPVAWLVRRPTQGLVAAVVAVAALTGLALLVGPPA